jgi:CubicO group peptidase (beta-lactamase class C family)
MNWRLLRPLACPLVAVVWLSLVPKTFGGESAGNAIAVTGRAAPDLKALDDEITSLMRKWQIPGGSLAVVKDGRLVFAHGYGLADRDAGTPVRPDSLFRIASVTKPFTAAAILALVERGRLDLDAKVLDILKTPGLSAEKAVDPRWKQITIRQLLQHTAGFDRDASFDPMFRSNEIAEATGTSPPAGPHAIIRYMLGRRLDFDPGAKFVYSNFGYCLLGRVIEQVAGKPYAEAVQNLVLRPAGITRMKIGRARLAERLSGEVRYYTWNSENCRSVFPDVRKKVPEPYGGFYIEAMDSHGAWVASAIDLVRFAAVLDGSRRPGVLKPATIRLIESRPPAPLPAQSPVYYGLGWDVRPVGRGANWWHNGSLPGTMTLLVRTHHGFAWAALFNLRPKDDGKFLGELDGGIWKAVGRVQKWPEYDLFTRY